MFELILWGEKHLSCLHIFKVYCSRIVHYQFQECKRGCEVQLPIFGYMYLSDIFCHIYVYLQTIYAWTFVHKQNFHTNMHPPLIVA